MKKLTNQKPNPEELIEETIPDLGELLKIRLPERLLINQKINIDKLEKEDKTIQISAICQWFFRNYTEPEDNIIINDDEKGCIWLLGGPYDAECEIQLNFGSRISQEVINYAVEAIESDGITEWSGLPCYDPLDDYSFELQMINTSKALNNLSSQIDFVQKEINNKNPKLNNLLFSSLISALEAFIWQNLCVVINDPTIAKKIIELSYKSIDLDELYKNRELSIDSFFIKKAREILGNKVFHKTKEIDPIFKKLNINESINQFKEEIEKRHDIVHRSGFNRNNEPTSISEIDIKNLISKIQTFRDHFLSEIKKI